jgi:hypothetical protein
MRCVVSALAVVGLVVAWGESASADLLYKQSSTPTEFNAWASVEGLDGSGIVRTYDNFVLTSDASVESLVWKGLYRDVAVPANNPVTPTSLSWQIGIYEDAGGLPGSIVDSHIIPAGNVATSFIGFASLGGDTVSVYRFETALPSPLSIAADVPHWLSVLSVAPTSEDRWGWWSGVGGDGQTVQDRFDGTRVTREFDRTFNLFGTFVPEPASGTLLAILSAAACLCRHPCR